MAAGSVELVGAVGSAAVSLSIDTGRKAKVNNSNSLTARVRKERSLLFIIATP
jgi:hypothetical protein